MIIPRDPERSFWDESFYKVAVVNLTDPVLGLGAKYGGGTQHAGPMLRLEIQRSDLRSHIHCVI